MIFYMQETCIGLIIASIPAVLSVFFFYAGQKKNIALLLLMLSAVMLRLLMISLDPFLHEWDEHFHALVAKNMIIDPFKPMLFAHPIVVHDMHDWSYSHIWLHKQPLFLWQMAVSMKIFGISEFAMRLPSALMSSVTVWLTYDIARIWTKDVKVAFVAGLLSCFSYYTLELVSGKLSLEHNDSAFIFYMTLSFWCFIKYTTRPSSLKWAVFTGVAVGCAILNKWLTGYLVFCGWGLYIMMINENQNRLRHFGHLALAFLASLVIFLPWQIYISSVFPVESAIEYKHNTEHLSKDFGHPGTWTYHFMYFVEAYHWIQLPFLLLGIGMVLFSKKLNKTISFPFISMALVMYTFFSFVVKAKMPTFTFPVSAIIFILVAIGLIIPLHTVFKKLRLSSKTSDIFYMIILLVVAFFSFKPFEIIKTRSAENEQRNKNIYNTKVIKQMHDSIPERYIVFNFRGHENIDYMFYKNGTGYHYYPDSTSVDTFLQQGYRLAALDFTDTQKLPDYIKSNPEILILGEKFR